MRITISLLALLVIGFVGTASTVIVDASEHVVVTRFGRPTAVYNEPGLRAKWPAPIERAVRLDKRRLFLSTNDAEFLTSDKKNVVLAAYATWRITDPVRFLSALRTRDAAEARLAPLIVSALGSAVGEATFADFVSDTGLAYAPSASESGEDKLAALEARVLDATSETAAKDFGIAIGQIGITRFIFPEQNLASVYARMRAERERIAKGLRAEGESEAQQIIAEANLKSAEITTSAEADSARILGEGEAEAAKIYADAYSGYEDLYSFLHTLDAYERIINKDTTLVLSGDSPLFDLLLRFDPDASIAPLQAPSTNNGLALQDRQK